MKKTLTYSTQSISKSCLATLGKSRLVIEPALSARWNDHSANEILNKGPLPLGAAPTAWLMAPMPIAAPAAAVVRRNLRRSSKLVIDETSQEIATGARLVANR